MNRILIIDDDVDTCQLLSRFLTKKGFEVESAYTGTRGIQALQASKYDIILCDFRLGDYDGRDILVKVKEMRPECQVIMITGYSDVKLAVEVMKMGAFNYITKPLLPDEILLCIHDALQQNPSSSVHSRDNQSEKTQQKKYASSVKTSNYIEGSSDEAKALYKQINLVAPTNFSIIIFGETGTGKESVAQRIHEESPRSEKPFIAVDCGALSKELAGSELFGHEKGSYTGAFNSKIGSFELANTGTLFLDEVGNLSYDIQVMLLRVLQEKQVRHIGGNKDIPVDVRIIVASNENLMDAVRKGRFREDLYHRFNEFSVTVPSLRHRNVDIMEFAYFFLQTACAELDKKVITISPEVEQIFLTYSWPGNLRELNNVIKRAALLSNSDVIEANALPQEIVYTEKFNLNLPVNENGNLHSPAVGNLKSAANDAELRLIYETLKKVKFNKSKAAELLNINRKTLYNKMKLYNFNDEEGV